MNPRNKRANSGANSPQQQFTSVPQSLIKVGLVLPTGCNICDMDWTPESESLSPTVAAFRSGVTTPLVEKLQGTLAVDGVRR